MKTFRGTLVVAVLLLAVVGVIRLVEGPSVLFFGCIKLGEGTGEALPVEAALYRFEKQEVVRVQVDRPDSSIVLVETDEGWIIESTGLRASRSMVNRVKHQLHDLTARASVIADAEDPDLYGLGEQAIEVVVGLREGREIRFKAGDPNPSAVSYYIQPVPGDLIYTVKKSAVDYYAFTLDEFRERRFAGMDSKDVDSIRAEYLDREPLELLRTGEKSWEMVAPVAMLASRDSARSLIGRVAALKARDFTRELEDPATEMAIYDLDTPRARIRFTFGSRDPLVLLVGRALSEDPEEELAYMMLEGEPTVYTARQALLEEYGQDPADFRLKRFMRMDNSSVVRVRINLEASEEGDPEGEVELVKGVSKWEWSDGRPVPGSTPERVAMRVAGVKAEIFVDDAPADLSAYGLDSPRARVVALAEDGTQRTLLLGAEGEARVDLEDREIARYYASVEGEAPVYLVDRGVFSVLQDAVREHGRKEDRDEDRRGRREAMEEARGGG